MIRLLVLLALLAGPAAATQDRWPALFDVTGVAADDVLNVRAGPGTNTAVIGSLAPDATGIEVVAPGPDHRWGRVNLGDGTGWVSLAYLARQPGQWLGTPPDPVLCTGTEPFWSLALGGGQAAFSSPDTETLTGGYGAMQSSANRIDSYGVTAEFGTATMTAHLRLAACTDGMSDRAYGIAIDLTLDRATGAQVLSGCCSLTAP